VRLESADVNVRCCGRTKDSRLGGEGFPPRSPGYLRPYSLPIDQWQCQICGKHWVVPDLARACERKHKEST
jgi:hypothetical protein